MAIVSVLTVGIRVRPQKMRSEGMFAPPAAPVQGDAENVRQLKLIADLRTLRTKFDGTWPQFLDAADTMTALRARIEALVAERDTFYMDYRMKADVDTKAAHVRAEAAERELAEARRERDESLTAIMWALGYVTDDVQPFRSRPPGAPMYYWRTDLRMAFPRIAKAIDDRTSEAIARGSARE